VFFCFSKFGCEKIAIAVSLIKFVVVSVSICFRSYHYLRQRSPSRSRSLEGRTRPESRQSQPNAATF